MEFFFGIQINDASIDRNILIIESKIRPILENGFSILPINKKYDKQLIVGTKQ